VKEFLMTKCCPDSGDDKKSFEMCAEEYMRGLAMHDTAPHDAKMAAEGVVEEIDTDTEPAMDSVDEPMLKRARTSGDVPIQTAET
jgi:hypothetical protein